MAIATTIQPHTQDVNITLSLSDINVINEIKKALKLFRGVEKVKITTVNHDITKTASFKEAIKDRDNGRVYHATSVDDMFKQILG